MFLRKNEKIWIFWLWLLLTSFMQVSLGVICSASLSLFAKTSIFILHLDGRSSWAAIRSIDIWASTEFRAWRWYCSNLFMCRAIKSSGKRPQTFSSCLRVLTCSAIPTLCLSHFREDANFWYQPEYSLVLRLLNWLPNQCRKCEIKIHYPDCIDPTYQEQ